MDVTPKQINEKQFRDAWRGYSQEEVDDFLDRVAEALENTQQENQSLRMRNRELEKALSTTREAEEMLKKTLVTAQRAAEEAIAKAKAKAEQLVAEAEKRARGANEEARQIIEAAESDARRRTIDIERQAENRRRELDAAISRLSAYQSDLQTKLRAFLEEQQRNLDALLESEPPSATGSNGVGGAGPHRPKHSGAPVERSRGGDASKTARIVHVDGPAEAPRGNDLRAQEAPSRRGVRGLFFREEA